MCIDLMCKETCVLCMSNLHHDTLICLLCSAAAHNIPVLKPDQLIQPPCCRFMLSVALSCTASMEPPPYTLTALSGYRSFKQHLRQARPGIQTASPCWPRYQQQKKGCWCSSCASALPFGLQLGSISSDLLHVASQAGSIGRWSAVVVCMTQSTVDLFSYFMSAKDSAHLCFASLQTAVMHHACCICSCQDAILSFVAEAISDG